MGCFSGTQGSKTEVSSTHGAVNGGPQTHIPLSLPGFSMPTRSTVYGQMPSRTCRTSRCSHSMTTRSRAWPKARSPPCGPSRLCECPHQLPCLGSRASGGKASPGLELVITPCPCWCVTHCPCQCVTRCPRRRHLAQNPFICDCNLKWLADFLRANPVETSGARCASPRRLANKRIGQIKSKKFRCSGESCPQPCRRHPAARLCSALSQPGVCVLRGLMCFFLCSQRAVLHPR